MITLGIESTAHTFGIGIKQGNKILANVKSTFTTDEGGMIPKDVAEHHVQVCDEIISKALKQANITLHDVDLIAYSKAPGIGHMLRIGAFVARSLSYQLKIPLVGVNHCIAHLEIGRLLTKAKDPILLYASGANTQVIAYEAGKYRIFGETLDIGVGNFIDSFARELGLSFPGGPKVYDAALEGKELIELPYSVKGMDVAFGGLFTKLKTLHKSGKYSRADLCYSAQETAYAMLVEVSERALSHTGKKELLLGGGVACNKRLQEMATQMCKERGAKCFILENEYNVDNGAMIAHLGSLMYNAKHKEDITTATIDPYERTDDVIVDWR